MALEELEQQGRGMSAGVLTLAGIWLCLDVKWLFEPSAMNLDDIRRQQALWLRQGVIDRAVPIDDRFDTSFAQATVKLQAIQADTVLAPEAKQTAMVAAVTEVGLDPAKYNAIGRAAQADATLRAKVQTAMSKYASPAPAEG